MLTVANIEARIESIRDHLSRDNYEVAFRNEIAMFQDVLLAIDEYEAQIEQRTETQSEYRDIIKAAFRVFDLKTSDGRPWRRGYSGGGPG